MILLKHNGEHEVKPTIFSDGTSNVWKLPLTPGTSAEIIWKFEKEAEIMHIAQLFDLLRSEGIKVKRLLIPYLPYARQDKVVTNKTTFALSTFCQMLGNIVGNTPTFALDVHNMAHFIDSIVPTEFILKAMLHARPDHLVFPDHGAYRRYHKLVDHPALTLDKTRNQLTGEITGIELIEDQVDYMTKDLPFKFLIIDDLTDAGGTFIKAAALLQTRFPNSKTSLYTTHSIFSRGFGHLLNNGINHIYTTDSYFNVDARNIPKHLTVYSTKHL